MMYWSDNVKTEAFVAVPKSSGGYPLFVSCHGGYDTSVDETHVASPTSAMDLEYAQSGFITLIPEYRGYANSGGTVPDFNGITLDTNNAIKAIQSHFQVEPNHIYLEGASMGGGVVLKLATERNDIRSVIAISPFVGWDEEGKWAVSAKKQNPRALSEYNAMVDHYGPFKPNSPTYEKESIDYTKIHVPALILQGTDDANVEWQTVQLFYNDLKPTDSYAKLILFPGGHHGLHGKYQQAVNKDISEWYTKYGEGASF
ncbi:alpha/beta fold hydrolase [Alicyclobacillus fastidiosus]|nr:alpha/beta fold hydrolase [Alicyclobacillus fastidiosus]WEH07779.1 alpha/beta fold hydrolase [Alicyclobacillus fastidiosus]